MIKHAKLSRAFIKRVGDFCGNELAHRLTDGRTPAAQTARCIAFKRFNRQLWPIRIKAASFFGKLKNE